MNEAPSSPEAYAILKLEAEVHALRSITSLLVADSAMATKMLRTMAGLAEEVALGSLLSDAQIVHFRNYIESVVEAVASTHERAGINPDIPQAEAARPWAGRGLLVPG